MADKITIYFPHSRDVDSCFGPICLVCLAATEVAKTRPARTDNPRVTKASPLYPNKLQWSVSLQSDLKFASTRSNSLASCVEK
jgi:hypothetical protein